MICAIININLTSKIQEEEGGRGCIVINKKINNI